MKIRINNVSYPIDEGSTLTENYNETLDSAVVRISHLVNEIDIEPFDDVELIDDNNEKYKDLCIDSYDCVQEAIGQNDTTFTYMINLFSLTKKLEGILLPNLSITPYKDVSSRISIYDYLKNIRDTYCHKYWNEEYVDEWGFSQRFIDKFSSIVCPETQWSQPTFRELFNALTMIGDSIVILRKKQDNETSTDTSFAKSLYIIDFIDLTQSFDASNKTYNFIRKTRSSDDYISEIRMELQNVMQTNVDGINNTVTTAEYLTLTTDNSIITSDNVYLKTQFPILNIKHLWIICYGLANDNSSTVKIKMDLCEFMNIWKDNPDTVAHSLVCEKKEYDAKLNIFRSNIPSVNDIKNPAQSPSALYLSEYKNFCIYFTRNSNRIEGLTDLSKALFSQEVSTLQYLKLFCACYNAELGIYYSNLGFANDINAGTNSYFSTFFQIEYETTYSALFQAGKTEKPRHNKIIADNQTNAWVDAWSQGFLEYQKTNRLGNLQKLYNQRKININDLYVIGDRIGDDIVYRTEYQFYVDHIEGNAYSTRNYVLRDYFTGIQSKIRTWVNAREEAFIRHDLKKYYCEFSYEQKTTTDQVETINLNKDLAYYLLDSALTNFQQVAKPIKYVLVVTKKGNTIYPSSTGKYAMNCITRLIGNSIVLTAGFDDNWIVDKHANTGSRATSYNDSGIISRDDIKPIEITENPYAINHSVPPRFDVTLTNIGGITTSYYKYCDDNGEFDNIKMYFLNDLKISNVTLSSNDNVKDLFIDYFNMPMVSDSVSNEYLFGIDLNIKKDNKEKPIISTQFEFCKDDSSISFTKLLLERQEMIRSIRDTRGLYLRLYDENHTFINEIGAEYNLSVAIKNDYCAEVQYLGPLGDTKYVTIVDYDKNPILTFDITKNDTRSLFLNIRRYL